MKMKISLCLLFLFLFVSIPFGSAQQVVLPEYEKWIVNDGSGFAFEVYEAVLNQSGLASKHQFRPLKRAILEYKNKLHDCFLGGDTNSARDYIDGLVVISSKPIMKIKHVAYTLKSMPLISSKTDLRGKNIGVVRGTTVSIYSLDGLDVNFDPVENVTQNIEKLKVGRIDAFLSVYPDEKKLINELHFDEKLVFYETTETLNCHPNHENKNYISKFNLGLDVIKKNGIYQMLYDRHYNY